MARPWNMLHVLDVVLAPSSQMTTTERIIVLALARYRNRDTGETWPCLESLAADTGLSRFAVSRALDRLRGRPGLPVTIDWIQESRRKSRRYTIELVGDKPDRSRAPRCDPESHLTSRDVIQDHVSDVIEDHNSDVIESHMIHPSDPPKGSTQPISSDQAGEVWDTYIAGWRTHVGKGREPKSSKKRLGQIRARLKAYDAAEVLTAVANLWASQWHRDNGQTMPELVFRDDSRIEFWLARKPDLPATRRAAPQQSGKSLDELDAMTTRHRRAV